MIITFCFLSSERTPLKLSLKWLSHVELAPLHCYALISRHNDDDGDRRHHLSASHPSIRECIAQPHVHTIT